MANTPVITAGDVAASMVDNVPRSLTFLEMSLDLALTYISSTGDLASAYKAVNPADPDTIDTWHHQYKRRARAKQLALEKKLAKEAAAKQKKADEDMSS